MALCYNNFDSKKTLTTMLRLIKPSISAHHWCVVLVLFYLNRKVSD